MADPLRHFYDTKQKEMAAQVWALAATKTNFFSTICSINQYRFTTPDAKRVLHAKDWCTYYRQDGAPEDNDAVNQQLGKAKGYYSGECIAEVEHFYVAAFMQIAIGPAITQLGVFGYETLDITLKNPLMKAADAYNHGRDIGAAFWSGFPKGFSGWFNSIKWNGGQALRAQSGIAFGSELAEGQSTMPIVGDLANAVARATVALRDSVNFVERALAEPLPPRAPSFGTTPIGTCPIPKPPPGTPDKEFKLDFNDPKRRSLSAVSMAVYNTFDLWPLIWWHNPSLAANPNKLKGLTHVRYREISTYSQADIAAAKAAAPSWKNYAP
jgi:hypothetical protein